MSSPTASAQIQGHHIGEVVVREFTPEEFGALQGIGMFNQFAVPDPDLSRAIVAQRVSDMKIVGYWFVFQAIHVEPLWIDPEYRKRPGLARRMWGAVQEVLIDVFRHVKSAPLAYAIIADGDAASNLPAATRLGFKRVPGSLFFVDVRGEGEELGPIDQVLEELRENGGGNGIATDEMLPLLRAETRRQEVQGPPSPPPEPDE